jgi:hypothetical protein
MFDCRSYVKHEITYLVGTFPIGKTLSLSSLTSITTYLSKLFNKSLEGESALRVDIFIIPMFPMLLCRARNKNKVVTIKHTATTSVVVVVVVAVDGDELNDERDDVVVG